VRLWGWMGADRILGIAPSRVSILFVRSISRGSHTAVEVGAADARRAAGPALPGRVATRGIQWMGVWTDGEGGSGQGDAGGNAHGGGAEGLREGEGDRDLAPQAPLKRTSKAVRVGGARARWMWTPSVPKAPGRGVRTRWWRRRGARSARGPLRAAQRGGRAAADAHDGDTLRGMERCRTGERGGATHRFT